MFEGQLVARVTAGDGIKAGDEIKAGVEITAEPDANMAGGATTRIPSSEDGTKEGEEEGAIDATTGNAEDENDVVAAPAGDVDVEGKEEDEAATGAAGGGGGGGIGRGFSSTRLIGRAMATGAEETENENETRK